MNLHIRLKTCRMFADLDDREIAELDRIAHKHDYGKGDPIFHEGEQARGFFAVVAGTVKIFRTGPDGRERVLHVVEAGETFAEAAIFMNQYPATAQALSPGTIVIQIDGQGFRRLLTTDSKLMFKIYVSLVYWLREMRDALTDFTLKEAPARFASYILSLPSPSGPTIKINISKTTLAQMIGTTKETLSRLLRRLHENKILTYRGNTVKIINRARLQRIATGEEKI